MNSENYYINQKPAETYDTHSLQTGIAPPGVTTQERSVTEKGKVEIWFIEPLLRFSGDEGFVCLFICFPLLEALVRYELGVQDDVEFTFSENSPALNWFAKFMTIPKSNAQQVWDALRNGLMHRGMIKKSVLYILTDERTERPAEFKDDILYIHIWVLRDKVVELLLKHHKRLWNDSSYPLPHISVRS